MKTALLFMVIGEGVSWDQISIIGFVIIVRRNNTLKWIATNYRTKSTLLANQGKQSNTSDETNIAENYLSDGEVLMIYDMKSKPTKK